MRKALQTEKCTTLVDAGRPGFTVQGRSCCHDVSIEHLEGAVARVVYLNFCHFCLLFICGLRQQHQPPTLNHFFLSVPTLSSFLKSFVPS